MLIWNSTKRIFDQVIFEVFKAMNYPLIFELTNYFLLKWITMNFWGFSFMIFKRDENLVTKFTWNSNSRNESSSSRMLHLYTTLPSLRLLNIVLGFLKNYFMLLKSSKRIFCFCCNQRGHLPKTHPSWKLNLKWLLNI